MKQMIKSPIFWGIVAALLLIIPNFQYYQFYGSDITHIGVLEGTIDFPGLEPLSLYRFSDGTPEHMNEVISKGYFPWYTSPYWKMYFCRHLPSALIALNHKISGMEPAGYMVHNIFWYLLLIVMLGILYRRLIPGLDGKAHHPAVYIALLLFALAMRQQLVVFYGSARWMMVVTVFALAGLLAHIKWREHGWKPGRYLSLIWFFLALLSGEAALAILAYLAAYELFGRSDPLKKRIHALLPTAIMVFIYLVIYKIVGYGGGGMGTYVNPFSDPVGFIAGLPVKMVSMIGEMVVGFISLLGVIEPDKQPLLTFAVGLGSLLIFFLLFYPLWKRAAVPLRRTLNWLMIGTVAGMLPLSSVNANSRVVMYLSFGSSILLGLVVHHWWQRIRQKPKSWAWIGALACIGILGLHLVYSPYIYFRTARTYGGYFSAWTKLQETSILKDLQPHHKAVFLNGTGGDMMFSGLYLRKLHRLPMPESWWPLSYAPLKHRYHRTADDTLELEMIGGSLFKGEYSFFSRKYSPLKIGDVVQLEGLRITILEVNEQGPTRIEFKFGLSLDDESFRFFKLNKEKLELVKPPPIGESLTV